MRKYRFSFPRLLNLELFEKNILSDTQVDEEENKEQELYSSYSLRKKFVVI